MKKLTKKYVSALSELKNQLNDIGYKKMNLSDFFTQRGIPTAVISVLKDNKIIEVSKNHRYAYRWGRSTYVTTRMADFVRTETTKRTLSYGKNKAIKEGADIKLIATDEIVKELRARGYSGKLTAPAMVV